MLFGDCHNICLEGLRNKIKILTLDCSHLTVYYVCVLCYNILSHSVFYVYEISHTGQVHFCSDVLNWNSLTYLLTCLLVYVLTYFLTYLLTCLLTYVLSYLLSYLPTYLFTYLRTYLLSYLPTYLFTHLNTYLISYLLNYFLA